MRMNFFMFCWLFKRKDELFSTVSLFHNSSQRISLKKDIHIQNKTQTTNVFLDRDIHTCHNSNFNATVNIQCKYILKLCPIQFIQ